MRKAMGECVKDFDSILSDFSLEKLLGIDFEGFGVQMHGYVLL